jgi:eukaryotic-like serine/threonine-protein kinase
VYVRPFPNVDGGLWQISTGGGTRPVWSRDGAELFYLDASGLLTSVIVETRRSFGFGSPTKVLSTRYFSGFGGSGQAIAGRTYDVSADGKRFLMIKEVPGDQTTAAQAMVVTVNSGEELRARVRAK